jgi:hypothetical protein
MVNVDLVSHTHRLPLLKVKQSRYKPKGPRGFQEVKVPRFHDNGTGWW